MPTLKEFREAHAVYQAILQKELGHELPLPVAIRAAIVSETAGEETVATAEMTDWLDLLDLAVTPSLLRTYVVESGAPDASLRSVIRFLVSKPRHSQADRDKLDWLVTHLFQLREERAQRHMTWPKGEIEEMLGGFEFPYLSRRAEELLNEFPALLDEVKYFENFSQITDSRIIQRARDLKNQFQEEFFHPDVLAALVNYNLSFGRKFNTLLEATMKAVHQFAQADPRRSPGVARMAEDTVEPPDSKEFLKSDYRLTGDALRKISEIGRREIVDAAARPTAKTLGNAANSAGDQLKQLGIDAAQEALYLRNCLDELTMRLRSKLNMTTVPCAFAPLPLAEWEAAAFRSPIPDTEQSFRADFARGVCRSIGIIYRIYEEIPLYLEKRGTEFLWKRHYDSLVFLLHEGRITKDNLMQMAAQSTQRGLKEKSKQLESTAQKLDASLAKVAALF